MRGLANIPCAEDQEKRWKQGVLCPVRGIFWWANVSKVVFVKGSTVTRTRFQNLRIQATPGTHGGALQSCTSWLGLVHDATPGACDSWSGGGRLPCFLMGLKSCMWVFLCFRCLLVFGGCHFPDFAGPRVIFSFSPCPRMCSVSCFWEPPTQIDLGAMWRCFVWTCIE